MFEVIRNANFQCRKFAYENDNENENFGFAMHTHPDGL